MKHWLWMMVLVPVLAYASPARDIQAFARCELNASGLAYREALYWHHVLTSVAHPMARWRYVKVYRRQMQDVGNGLQLVDACTVPVAGGTGIAAHAALLAADSIVRIESEYGLDANKAVFLGRFPHLLAAHRTLLTLAR